MAAHQDMVQRASSASFSSTETIKQPKQLPPNNPRPKRRTTHRNVACFAFFLAVLLVWMTGGELQTGNWSSMAQVSDTDLTNGPPVPPRAMAACLLMFDDNLSLVEWLAYHYHTMPLRHVIVLTDPRSTESPLPILQRWDGLMTYEYWNEERVFQKDPETLEHLRRQGDLVKLHRARQGHFYAQCMRELKLRSQKQEQENGCYDQWLILTDVDEYVTINPRIADPHHNLYRPHQNTTLNSPGSIYEFLQHEKRQPPACLHMARRDMVSKESSMEEISVGVPSFLDPTVFFTTRWRHQSHRKITGKCLVNLALVPYRDLPPFETPRQGHVPLAARGYCPNFRAKDRYTMENTPLVVHHYLGTQAQYQHRDDPRRDRTTDGFARKQQQSTTVQDDTRTWLQGFVAQVGRKKAAQLLQGAGEAQ